MANSLRVKGTENGGGVTDRLRVANSLRVKGTENSGLGQGDRFPVANSLRVKGTENFPCPLCYPLCGKLTKS